MGFKVGQMCYFVENTSDDRNSFFGPFSKEELEQIDDYVPDRDLEEGAQVIQAKITRLGALQPRPRVEWDPPMDKGAKS